MFMSGTLIGASANLTVAGISERNGVPFRFVTYTLYAMPMMVVSVAICHVYVWCDDRRLGEPDRSGYFGAQWSPVSIRHLHALRHADDGGVGGNLPCLCLV